MLPLPRGVTDGPLFAPGRRPYHDLAGYIGDLNDHCVTIAQVLKPAGYGTYMVGKLHITPHVAPTGPKYNWPLHRGFDRYYGTINGADSYFDPASLTRDDTMINA